jgi:hypothetical protein
MGLTTVTSAASRHRIARARDWLHARRPAEEVLIIGATLGAANELTLGLAQEKRASFGYLSEAGALGRYANLTSGPGFARAIANVITELRLEQVEPDAVAQVAPDLRPLLQEYERELGQHGFTDWPAVLRLAARSFCPERALCCRHYGHLWSRLRIPTEGGQHSDDCGQRVRAA